MTKDKMTGLRLLTETEIDAVAGGKKKGCCAPPPKVVCCAPPPPPCCPPKCVLEPFAGG